MYYCYFTSFLSCEVFWFLFVLFVSLEKTQRTEGEVKLIKQQANKQTNQQQNPKPKSYYDRSGVLNSTYILIQLICPDVHALQKAGFELGTAPPNAHDSDFKRFTRPEQIFENTYH